MEDFMCNVLVMGKTGTGKSSLLNYICDADLAQTGTGKPVTGEGIYDYVVKINNQDVRIFDSWGIEAGKVDRWKDLINKSLIEHGTQKSIQDWFHSVIYCVQAGGGRVEDIDVEIIRQFLSEGYKITIVLTKADQVDEEDEAKMKNTIASEICGKAGNLSKQINIIATCSQKKKTRSGETHPFGKEDVCNAIITGWKDTIMERLPKHVVARICDYIQKEMEIIEQNALNSKISGIAEENINTYNKIQDQIHDLTRRIDREIFPQILKEAAESCHKANMSLKAILNVNIEVVYKDEITKKGMTWWKAALLGGVSYGFGLIGLGVVGVGKGIIALIHRYKANNTNNIAEQKHTLHEEIEKTKNELIAQYKAQESNIARQLNQTF